MAEETPVKGKHRKLKRIVQKKARVGLNTSGSVNYYKKVKAALNASLNTSRVRKTLAANNRALAQSLQQVKQELRNAYNENARLKVENQEMTMRLMRFEQQQGSVGDQANLEQRIRSLRSLLHEMSRHLLEVGTCLNDSIDLCALTPRTSHGSDTSFPPCPPDSNPAETRRSKGLDDPAAEQADSSLLESQDGQESASAFSNMGYGIPDIKRVALPDMSVIMEQSVIDLDEDIQVEQVQMETVFEELPTPISTSVKNTMVDKCKRTTSIKLPQRVPISTKKSNKEDKPVCGKMSLTQSSHKTNSANKKLSEIAGSADQVCHQGTSNVPCSTVSRRETFVVSKTALVLGEDNGEGIDSIEMPDLVSDVSILDAEDGRAVDKEGVNSAAEQPRALELSESSQEPKRDVLYMAGGVLNGVSAPSTKQNLADNKSAKTLCKFKKPSAPVPQCVQKSKKDCGFFISNPCALNLVHQKVMGSNDGCLTMEGSDLLTAAGISSSASSFVAEIKASNRSSEKIASIIASPGHSKDVSIGKSDETRCLPDRTENQNVADPAKHEPDYSDCTMYFNTDMDFTEVLPPAVGLEVMPEIYTETVSAVSCSANLPKEKTKSELANETENEAASKPKDGIQQNKNCASGDSDADSNHGHSGDEKKTAVALRVAKPGQMVFAVSRKEEDGSRKAIPAKIPTKARSKSRREIEEMKKHLPVEEPKTIFDFHDRTPQHMLDKSKPTSSVFDLSLSENVSASVPSLASVREKLNTFSKKLGCSLAQEDVTKINEELSRSKTNTDQEFDRKSTVSYLLGDAQEYRLPLKIDDSPHLATSKCGKTSSRTRSSSQGRNLQRQSRSKSRSRKEEVLGTDKDLSDNDSTSTEAKTAEARSGAGEGQDASKARGRSRSRHGKSANQPQAQTEESSEPRRSARSKSGVRKRYLEEDSITNFDDSLNIGEKESCKSKDQRCSRLKRDDGDDDDEDYKPSFEKNKSAKQRGRSRSRHKKDEKQGEDNGVQADAYENSASSKVFEGADAGSEGCRSKKKTSSKNQPAESRDQLQTSEASVSEMTKCPEIPAAVPDSSINADALMVADTQVTERRHRSKSTHKKLHCESEHAKETFESIISDIPDLTKNTVKEAKNRDVLLSEVETDSKYRSRGSGESILGSESEKLVSKIVQSSVAKQDSQECDGRIGVPEKRQLQKEDEHAKCASPVPAKKDKQCMLSPNSKKLEVAETRQHEKEAERRNCVSLLPAKKGKPSSPSLTSKKLESKQSKATQHLDTKREFASKKAKQDVLKCGQVDYHQQLEEVKRKLQELDQPVTKASPERSGHPVKKSRPLVLPTFPHDTVNKIQKSPVLKPDADKINSLRPVERGESHTFISNSSGASSPRLSSARSSLQTPDSGNEGAHNGRASRRAGSAVSYKEPPLNKKLRRGDPHTSYLHKDEQLHVFKSPRSQRKHFGASQGERCVFADLTNLSIAEAEGEAQ